MQTEDKTRNTEIMSNSSVTSHANASVNGSGKVIETMTKYYEILTPKSNWASGNNSVPCARRLQLPITNVYVREAFTPNCDSYNECKDTIWMLQRRHYKIYGTDIQFNFVIVADGSIFEGLSWDCKVTYSVPDSNSRMVSLTRAQQSYRVGYNGYSINTKQFTSLQLFLEANLISGNLSPTYQLLPLCCFLPGTKQDRKVISHTINFFCWR